MEIKVEIDDFEIIDSGSLVMENKQVINFNFKDDNLNLNFKIKFTQDESTKESKFNTKLNREDNYLEIDIINSNLGMNIGNTDIIPLAIISNRQLYLKFMISSGGKGDTLFNYSWYLKNDSDGGK